METLWQDLKYGARQLLRSPGFTVVAVLTLALGIGANTSIFSVVNGVLLRPLAYDDPDRIIVVWGKHPQIGREAASLPDFVDWRAQNSSFESMAGAARRFLTLTGGDEPERLLATLVTGDFFEVLRVRPILGRGFLPEEDRPGAGRVVLMGHGLWQRRFGSDPNIVGRTLTLNGELYTVVGVAPPHLQLLSSTELWAPLARDPAPAERRNDFLFVAGRLKPGVTLEQARADMVAITARLEQQYPTTNTGWSADLVPLHEQIVGGVRTSLLVLLGAVGFVLLIACVNVANLMLARAGTRGREIAIRTALGAGRLRLVRQLLTESLLLAVLGGGVGLLLAVWGVAALASVSVPGIPRLGDVQVDATVLGFVALLSVLTGILFGLVPALQAARPDVNASLKEGGRGDAGSLGRHRFRSALVVAEVALSLVLLIGAGLMIRSIHRLANLQTNFNRDHLLTLQLTLPQKRYPGAAELGVFYQQLLERVRALPGVSSATTLTPLPLTGGGNFWSFSVAGRPAPPPGEVQDASIVFVGEQTVETLQIPLLQGRLYSEAEARNAEPVALINQSLAKRYFSEGGAVGQRITFGDPQAPGAQWLTIIGVVGDIRQEPGKREVYPEVFTLSPQPTMALVLRTALDDPLSLAPSVRSAVRELDRDLPVSNVRTMDEVLARVLAPRRYSM
ncbi:MAG: ABC transporter permease, partial [Burkholderiales bacterium]